MSWLFQEGQKRPSDSSVLPLLPSATSQSAEGQLAGRVGAYFANTAVLRGLGSLFPPRAAAQPSTSLGLWKPAAPREGAGNRKTVGSHVSPYMFLLLGWQSPQGEVSDPSWQDAGNRKQGRSGGCCSHPLSRASSQGPKWPIKGDLPTPAPFLSWSPSF